MLCKACGFEFSDSLPLCPKCAEPWEINEPETVAADIEAEDAAKILDAVGETLGGIASSVRKYADEAAIPEKLGDIASSVRKYADEANETIGDMAWRIEKKLENNGMFDKIKQSWKNPKPLIITGIAVIAVILFIALFTGSDGEVSDVPARGIRGNITATDGKNTYIFNIDNYKKGDKNTLSILTQGSGKIRTLDVPVIADIKFGVLVYKDKIYYKDATTEVLTNPYCVYDLKTKRDYVLFDAGENIVSFTVDDAGLYANKSDGSFVMLPHGK